MFKLEFIWQKQVKFSYLIFENWIHKINYTGLELEKNLDII